MDFQNPIYSAADRSMIDMQINHPVHGWIPFTAVPAPAGSELEQELYAAAIAAGNIAPYVPPPPLTPEEERAALADLTARQFRLGLLSAGIAPSQVAATIAAMPDGLDKERAGIEWEYAPTFSRTHPLISTVAGAMGLSEEQIDDMWSAALGL